MSAWACSLSGRTGETGAAPTPAHAAGPHAQQALQDGGGQAPGRVTAKGTRSQQTTEEAAPHNPRRLVGPRPAHSICLSVRNQKAAPGGKGCCARPLPGPGSGLNESA